MTATDLHDHDLEDRLRAVLRDRADLVTGPPPGVGEATPLLILGRTPPPARLRRVATTAAAACLVLAAAISVPRLANREAEPVDSGAPPAAAADPAPNLPPGTDLESVPPVFAADGDAHAVALAYLVDRLGDGNEEIRARLPEELTLEQRPSFGSITVFRWSQEDSGGEGLPGGEVLLRRDDRWAIVTSIVDGVSLDQISRVGDRVAGRPRTYQTDVAPSMSTVDLLALDGSAAPGVPRSPADDDLRYGNTSSDGTSFEVEVGPAPVVVSVRILGGRTLGISEVVLTSTTVTVDPHPTLSLGTPTEVAGSDLTGLWPGPADLDLPRSTPEETIGTFFQAAIGEPVRVEPLSDAEGLAGEPYRVTTSGGLTLRTHLARDVAGTGWFIVQVVGDPPDTMECGLGGLDDEPAGDALLASFQCPAVAGAVATTIAYGDGRLTWIARVEPDALERGVGLTIAPRVARQVLVVSRDADGELVGMRG